MERQGLSDVRREGAERSMTEKIHGKTCPKAPHLPDPRIPVARQGPNDGWLHAEDDDKPYDVDGLFYCGRCHEWLR